MIFKKRLTHDDIIKMHLSILKKLQYSSGLFAASKKNVNTGYDKAWLRDNFYECLAFEILGKWSIVHKTYRAILDIFLKHEYKIDWAIREKPDAKFKYIHARYHPKTFDEFWDEWGNKQNDSVGAILFKLGEIQHVHAQEILMKEDDYRITQKLVHYLESIEYWHDRDSGMWEEDEEIHASSVGACAAGLQMIKKIKGIEVPSSLIQKGKESLSYLLPRESERKFADLALLSLIWPYSIVTKKQEEDILENVEYHLLRKHGVIRYKNDYYYNKNPDGYSEEAEWTMGLSWLAIIHENLGNKEKAEELVEKAKACMTKRGLPELYYSNSDLANENTPLGWSESLFVIALHDLTKKHMKNFFG